MVFVCDSFKVTISGLSIESRADSKLPLLNLSEEELDSFVSDVEDSELQVFRCFASSTNID